MIESIAACLPDAPQHSLGTPKSFIPSILSPITKAVGPNYPNKLWTPPPHPFPAHHHRRLGPNPLEYLGLDKGSTGIQKVSGGRSLASVQRAAATGLQARGAALPPLLPRGLSPDDHWSRACSLVHPMSMTPQLPGKLVLAARRIKEMGSSVVAYRADRRAHVQHLANELRPLQISWREQLHPQVRNIIGSWHMPLLHVLALEAGSEDLFFTIDMSMGVTSLGRAMHSFVMPLKVTRPIHSPAELREMASRRNQELLARVRSSGDNDLDMASLAKTQAEIDSGIMLGPWPRSQLPEDLRIISRRFPIWEYHGAKGERKCRNLDDMSESGLNASVEDYESYSPKGHASVFARAS